MRDPIIIVTGRPTDAEVESIRLAASLSSIDFGTVLVDDTDISIARLHDANEDRVLDFGTRGVFMDRSGSMEQHMIISLGDEISRMAHEDYLNIRVYEDEIKAPLGKSPDKIRLRQKDWEVGSGRGLRR
jgi:hypothetical protein